MKKLGSLILACFLAFAAIAADSSVPPVFQMRLVLDAPAADSEPMALITNTGNNHTLTNVLNIQKTVLLDQTALASAKVDTDRFGQPQIAIAFTHDGGTRFAEVTGQNVGKRLAIIINGQLYSAPVINMPVTGGKATISGNFSKREANNLAKKISDVLKKE
jgi:preprotein translocase subunit SecD